LALWDSKSLKALAIAFVKPVVKSNGMYYCDVSCTPLNELSVEGRRKAILGAGKLRRKKVEECGDELANTPGKKKPIIHQSTKLSSYYLLG